MRVRRSSTQKIGCTSRVATAVAEVAAGRRVSCRGVPPRRKAFEEAGRPHQAAAPYFTPRGKWAGNDRRECAAVHPREGRPLMHETDLDRLPVVVDLVTAASVLGIGRTSAYELVRTGRWPTPVLRLGRRIRVPTAALRELLSLSTGSSELQAHVASER